MVRSDIAEALQRVDDSYAAFRATPGVLASALLIELQQVGGENYLVSDSHGYERYWPSPHTALLDLLDRIVHGVLAQLHTQGVYAIHAGAVVYRHRALIIAGRSGQGKTTLVLGLLRRGLSLLSDEFAIVEPAAQGILPYRRSLHVRPGTPELIPELRFLLDQPRHQLGGGSEWALEPDELARALPGSLAEPAPLHYVLLLDDIPQPASTPSIVPVPAAVATMELLRGTWATSVDFAGGLARLSRLLDGVVCARLRAGALEPTVEAIIAWLEGAYG